VQVRYYDAWYECGGEVLFVQMEFLPGGTLRSLAEAHALTEALARRAVRDCARALAYMHGKRIGHLDVKPENVSPAPARPPFCPHAAATAAGRARVLLPA